MLQTEQKEMSCFKGLSPFRNIQSKSHPKSWFLVPLFFWAFCSAACCISFSSSPVDYSATYHSYLPAWQNLSRWPGWQLSRYACAVFPLMEISLCYNMWKGSIIDLWFVFFFLHHLLCSKASALAQEYHCATERWLVSVWTEIKWVFSALCIYMMDC